MSVGYLRYTTRYAYTCKVPVHYNYKAAPMRSYKVVYCTPTVRGTVKSRYSRIHEDNYNLVKLHLYWYTHHMHPHLPGTSTTVRYIYTLASTNIGDGTCEIAEFFTHFMQQDSYPEPARHQREKFDPTQNGLGPQHVLKWSGPLFCIFISVTSS
jgi:hypothetical protein